jgi:hypothetical protein
MSEMSREPDFFLSAAAEMRPDADLSQPRACWTKARLRNAIRDDYMLIDVDPPVIGQPYGLGSEDITRLIIATRWEGCTLFPIKQWNLSVYVLRILDEDITRSLLFTQDQIEEIAWATIYRTREEAEGELRGSQAE